MRFEQKVRVAEQKTACYEVRKTVLQVRRSSFPQLNRGRRFARTLNRLLNLTSCICCLSVAFATASHAQQNAPSKGKAANPAAAVFDSSCAVCHGSDGRGGERAPNIATKREVVNLSDAQLTVILNKGVLASGMPPFSYLGDEKIMQLVQYLRELQGVAGSGQALVNGDASEGEKIFFAEGSCSHCHMIHGRGGFLGEDLSTYARGRSAEAIRTAIIHPGDSPGGTDHIVDIQTTEGKSYRGLIRSRDNFNIVLQGEDGAYHGVARDQIQKMMISSQPLMPQDYETKLDEKRINDLISYLLRSSSSEKPVIKKNEEDHK
jgi:putative heme-binding domain-containing protein